MSLPAIIPSAQVRRFCYVWNCSLYDGMMFEGQIYKLLKDYDLSNRAKAFERACDLGNQGRVVISTEDSQCYSLWIDVCMDIATLPKSNL